MTDTNIPAARSGHRIGWVDYAKGICIVLVVLLNASYGVEHVTGETSIFSAFNTWARPFRMPDFFLISGLFLARRINRPWRSYLDTKVAHFAYFYVLWMTVWYVVRIPQYAEKYGNLGAALLYPFSFIQPLGSLWFIYMLAVFFVAAKLLDRFPHWAVWLGAAFLHALQLHTGWRVIDEFASRFVFFWSGYILAPYVFAIAEWLKRRPAPVLLGGLLVWGAVHTWFMSTGLGELPVINLILGYAGIAAIVTFGLLLEKTPLGKPMRYLGARTLPVFLSYFLFAVAMRIILLKSGLVSDINAIIVLATMAGVAGPLILERLVRNTPLSFLYERPAMFRIPPPSGVAGGSMRPQHGGERAGR